MGEHFVARGLGSGVPVTGGVVPEEDADVFCGGVVAELFDFVVADLGIPEGVDEAVGPVHVGGVVDEFFLDVEGSVFVAEERPGPGGLAGLDEVFGGGEEVGGRGIGEVGAEGGFGDGFE